MDKFASNLIEQVNSHAINDLSRFKLVQIPTEETPQTKQEHLGFVKYLVSVATHPIGLKASVSPLNSSQNHMLAYLMDMFMDGPQEEDQIETLKRHSWRPELKIRITRPPAFLHNELSNLYIRLYLFKPEQHTAPVKHFVHTSGRGVLDKIFQRFRLGSSALLIRPVNELRSLIKFEPDEDVEHSSYRMSQVDINTAQTQQGDLKLNIRRYYCDPKTVHMLRFEFWLDSAAKQTGWFNQYRRCLRRLVYNGNCFSRDKKSTYMNERQEFYGFINIKLTQVPSYFTKSIYPILTLRERKVNSCEISIEPRNRQPVRDEQSLVKHIRLYINCLLYQILSLKDSLKHDTTSVSMDSLFYLPAHTLINQHRLQCNLTQFQDSCCRRLSTLLLLMQIEEQEGVEDFIKRVLISVAQNEYMLSYRTDELVDGGRLGVISLEILIMKEYYSKFLTRRLRTWFLKLDTRDEKNQSERSLTLSSLKLFKLALSFMRKSYRNMGLLQEEVILLKKSLEQLLCKSILNFLGIHLTRIFNQNYSTPDELAKPNHNPWLDLLHKIKHIDHDLGSHWSRKGLDGLFKKHGDYVRRSSWVEEKNFKSTLLTKLDDFLR